MEQKSGCICTGRNLLHIRMTKINTLFDGYRFMGKSPSSGFWIYNCTLGTFTVSFFSACAGFTQTGFLSLRLNAVSGQLIRMSGKCRSRNLTSWGGGGIALSPLKAKIHIFELQSHFSLGQAWISITVTVLKELKSHSLKSVLRCLTNSCHCVEGFKSGLNNTCSDAMLQYKTNVVVCIDFSCVNFQYAAHQKNANLTMNR